MGVAKYLQILQKHGGLLCELQTHTQISNSVEHWIGTVSVEDGISALHYFHRY